VGVRTYPLSFLLHSGLGKLEQYPGDAFVHDLTAKCLQHDLQAFGILALSGLIGVSGAAQQLIYLCVTGQLLTVGSTGMAVLQGYSDLRHQPDEAFVRSFVQAFTAACSEGRVDDQVRITLVCFSDV
jgi:hypothetical protein